MNALEFRVISEAEADHFERAVHNAPCYTGSFTEDDFSREWWATRAALKERIELFGEEWQLATDRGDFMLSESRGNSRWIYVTFVSTRLWRPEFVHAVADLLGSLAQDYRVGCITELNDDEVFDQPLIYLVISSTTVFGRAEHPILDSTGALATTECRDALIRFGFPGHGIPSDT
jgi:hypothetical protein